jgi:hypothetical protein
MRKFKSILHTMPAIIIATAFLSCGGSATKKSGDSTANSGSDSSKKNAMSATVATPFDVVDITHTVKDYAKWRPVFDADSVNRKAAGIQDLAVGRDVDSANRILVVLKFSDIAKTKAMAADPKLKETMDKSGVISKPDFGYYHIIRFSGKASSKQWVVVNHKVKDFDAWLKVFDNEGAAKRASEGFVDRALGRGIDDPNMVHIVFGVTDMAKAKAAIFSDEKKKLMMSAGVIGTPDIRFYNAAQ